MAFGDDRIHAVTDLSGLAVVVSLSSLPELLGYPASDYSAIRENIHKASSGPRPAVTLAERLWTVLANPPEPSRTIPLHWAGDLMPFQQQGVRALLENRRLLLADDMGLGKTVQAITALRILRARREIKSCLITAPASVLNQWRREIEKWAPELSAIIIRGSVSDRSWQWHAEKEITLVSLRYPEIRLQYPISGGSQKLGCGRSGRGSEDQEPQRYERCPEGVEEKSLLGSDRHPYGKSRRGAGLDTGVR